MNAITVSREYGAGGAETARRLAEALGWQLLDRELLHQAAVLGQLSDAELERIDEQAVSLFDRLRWDPPQRRYFEALTRAVQEAAARGKVVLVGRGAQQTLASAPGCFHLRLVAPLDSRVRRVAALHGLTEEQARSRCREVDQARYRFIRYFFGKEVHDPEHYHLVVNTGRVPLEDVVACVVDVVQPGPAQSPLAQTGPRLMTLSQKVGAWTGDFARELGERLGVPVHDRVILDQEAIRLGVAESVVEQLDEQAGGLLERLLPGSLHHRYVIVLGQLLSDLAGQGDGLFVGRAANWFLRDRPEAFHVRIIAPPGERVRQVMAHYWMREGPARDLMERKDTQLGGFYRLVCGADWDDPLPYHLIANTGRLHADSVDLVAGAAVRHWQRQGPEKGEAP